MKPPTAIFLALLALLLTGCKKQASAGPSGESVRSVAVGPSASVAAKVDSAEVFVRDLYAHYASGAGDFSPLFQPDAGRYFSPGVIALKRADDNRTPGGDEGAIGTDPICACQDEDGLTLVSLTLVPTQPGKIDADVALRIMRDGSKITKLQLKLVQTAAGWRVDDVIPADPKHGTGLRAAYEQASKSRR